MNNNIIDGLIADWDEVYKKGQLGLWVLLALYDGRKYTAEITDFMKHATGGRFEVKEQSLYRALRRFNHMELVSITIAASPNSGSNRKYYSLTPLGKVVLGRFIRLHILPLLYPTISKLIQNAAKEESSDGTTN